MINNTFILNPIRVDFIHRALETLYEYTDMSQNRVIVVDQTLDGLKLPMDKVHLVLRPHRNLGFSKSMNEGIIHALRWGSKYITCSNDDVEWINRRWWDGILETFAISDRILAVNPECPKEAGWGYGVDGYIDILPYKEKFTDEDYDFLLKGDFQQIREEMLKSGRLTEKIQKSWEAGSGFPAHKEGVTDAIATWSTTFKRECLERFGLFDERFYPGGAEDYDINARVYRDDMRMVGTTKSWIWHWWGMSKDVQPEARGKSLPIIPELCWQDTTYLWPPEKNGGQVMDPWGHWTDKEGNKHPLYRESEVGIVDI